jgi:hypothetical protein
MPAIPQKSAVVHYVAVCNKHSRNPSWQRTGSRMTDTRRYLLRQETHWRGSYTIEGAPSSTWGECEVVDISIQGAGLEFMGDADHALRDMDESGEFVGRRILVEVQTPAGLLKVAGEIRHSMQGNRGMRVGISFSDLSETEDSILNALEQMRAVW